ncbi:MAG: hypothetical protein WBE37_17455 [Bryobacteraceae bacterium]
MDSSALASSILALRSSIKSLESCSNSLEWLLYVFVALVVIGVVLEVGFVVWEYREDMKEFRRGIIHSPHRPSGRKLLFELVGAGLVAIGVAGELAIDVKSGGIQTALRAKNGELIDLLQNASAVALRAASENEKEAAQLRKDAEGLKKSAEGERAARVKLEKQIAPRTLTESDRVTIGNKLRPFAPSFSGRKVEVSSYSGDAEGIVFSLEILDVLMRAGIGSDPVIGRSIPVGLVNLGVDITGPLADQPFMKALGTDIHDRIGTGIVVKWDPKYTKVAIAVGVKPVAGLPTVVPASK